MADDPADVIARERDRLDLLRRRLINVVGHELKLPVSTIRGLAEALGHATPTEIHDEIAPALARNCTRLERLVDDLLLASGVLTVLPVGRPRAQPVGPVVVRAWTQVGGTGELRVQGDPETAVLARSDALDRILAALLDNALKYGRPPMEVHVRNGEGMVAVDVKSGGAPGEDDLALALEPFYRGEAAVTSAPGLGIGLAVAAALAAQDGGRVEVRAEGDAVVATVELPRP